MYDAKITTDEERDATGQALAYVYARDTRADADTAKVLTMDEARRVANQHCKAADAVKEGRIAQYASATALCIDPLTDLTRLSISTGAR